MLRDVFFGLCFRNNISPDRSQKLWDEIEKAYTHKKRHYHNLKHIEGLVTELDTVKKEIADWDCLLFSVFYHDIVYNPLKNDNEERSADIAVKRLTGERVSQKIIDGCRAQVLATKAHEQSTDNDINLFTDADLSVLGAGWHNYKEYALAIRKEYVVFPDIIYKPGRKKVLQHFLQMKNIFKTAYFSGRLEESARMNISRELEELN
jgi:predicted metal-dependent HD superfamily phosphohydrolase